MAMSTCIKCNSTFFEMKEATPKGSRFKLNFVQCSQCGGVVGVVDYFNIGQELQDIKQELGRMSGRVI